MPITTPGRPAPAERVYVHEAVYHEFLEKVAEKTRALVPGTNRDSSYGPMTMPSQIDVVRRHILDAMARGGSGRRRRAGVGR